MEIRLARRSEVARIIEIRSDAFSRTAPSAYTEVEVETLLGDYTEEEFLEMISDERLLVAVVDGVIRGTAGWAGKSIRHVYVDPDFFGLGIGTKLMSRAEADYQRRTNRDFINAAVILYARGFYEKCGYVLVAKEKDWDGSEYYHMRKQFAAPDPT